MMLMDYSTRGRRPNLLRDMLRMQDEVNRLFGGLRFFPASEFPAINVWTGPEGAILTAEIAGVDPEKLEITVHRDTVTLRGTRGPSAVGDDATILRLERPAGDFARTTTLPFRVDADKASSRFENGVLTLELSRPEADKPRQIKVAHA
jgi:HSP20 family protein